MSGPQLYVKRPVEIMAMQWTGENYQDVLKWVGWMQNMDGDVRSPRFAAPDARYEDDVDGPGELIHDDGLARLWVEANHAWLPIEVGEWILQDRLGFYPCKDPIFQENYRAPSTHPAGCGSW